MFLNTREKKVLSEEIQRLFITLDPGLWQGSDDSRKTVIIEDSRPNPPNSASDVGLHVRKGKQTA